MSTDVIRIVEDCEKYWIETGVPRRFVLEMRAELEQHLKLAAAEGKAPEAVVGPDLARFAESWAEEQRDPVDDPEKTWKAVTSRRRKQSRFGLALVLVVAVIGVSAAVFNGGSSDMDNELWRWVWIAAPSCSALVRCSRPGS